MTKKEIKVGDALTANQFAYLENMFSRFKITGVPMAPITRDRSIEDMIEILNIALTCFSDKMEGLKGIKKSLYQSKDRL